MTQDPAPLLGHGNAVRDQAPAETRTDAHSLSRILNTSDRVTFSHHGCEWEASLMQWECPPPKVVHGIFVNQILILNLLTKYYCKSFCK